jgi:hypothetical protein
VAETKIAKIQMRRGASTAWSTNNPVLSFGEIGIEDIGTGPVGYKMKIGDGTTAWNVLPYYTSVPLAIARSVDMTSIGQTAVFTVSAGCIAVITRMMVLHRDVTTPASASTTIRFGPSSDPSQLVDGEVLSVTGSTDVDMFDLGNFFHTAGAQLEFGVTAGSGSPTHLCDIVLEGLLIPA